MINIGGYELNATSIIICLIIVYLVVERIIKVFLSVKSILSTYHNTEAKKDELDKTIKNHSKELNSVEDSLEEVNKQYESIMNILQEYTSKIENIDETIDRIKNKQVDVMKRQEDIMEIQKMQIRHSIVMSCEEYLSRSEKEIESKELQSLQDLNDVYVNILKGNSYVKTLVKKVTTDLVVVSKYTD